MTSTNDWPFDKPRNLAVFTTRQVLDDDDPFLEVYYDGDWQFIGDPGGDDTNGRIITLEEALLMDGSVRELADLPVGFRAIRKDRASGWIRGPIPPHHPEA